LKFSYKQLIIPSALIGYGVIALNNNSLKSLNLEIREEVNEHIDEKFTIDDISQYVPAVSVYALNAFGVKGKHNFKDRTIILGTAYVIMSGTVFGLKKWTKVERPDGSSNNSFPSGHTANAFMGAEFLYQEYKDVSPWYGIAGYVVATGTGLFRMYNNRHWFSDVVAGAGFGILSTKVAYWIYPWMKEKIFKDKDEKYSGMAMPFYNGKQAGVGLVLNF
jgi:membrane-associated phospholipid phosphatase